MHSYRALYYPFIHFKDVRWLKRAALYWDSITRIVPGRYLPEDGPTVRELGAFIEAPVRPEVPVPPDKDISEFDATFIEFLDEHGGRLRDRYGFHLQDKWPDVPVMELPPSESGPSGSNRRLGYVFFEKLSPALHRALVGTGLAEPDPVAPWWIGVHPALARVYMMALADQLAGERGLFPLTSEPLEHVAMGGLSVERLAHALLGDTGSDASMASPSKLEIETLAAFVAIEMVVPRLDDVPVERILEFREKTFGNNGRSGAFQTYLSDFLDKRSWITGIQDPHDLADALRHEYTKELQPKLEELKAKLREANFQTTSAVGTLQVTAPLALVKGFELAGYVMNPVVALGAGGALAVAKVWRDRRKARREALVPSAASFLFTAQDELAPTTVLGWIADKVRGIFG